MPSMPLKKTEPTTAPHIMLRPKVGTRPQALQQNADTFQAKLLAYPRKSELNSRAFRRSYRQDLKLLFASIAVVFALTLLLNFVFVPMVNQPREQMEVPHIAADTTTPGQIRGMIASLPEVEASVAFAPHDIETSRSLSERERLITALTRDN